MAGILKPTGAGAEATWTLGSYRLYRSAATTGTTLLDGAISSNYDGGYLTTSPSGYYFEATITTAINIWCLPHQDYTVNDNDLDIYKWNGTNYVSVSPKQNPRGKVYTWVKCIENLLPGTYQFFCKGDRVDVEWYFEQYMEKVVERPIILSDTHYSDCSSSRLFDGITFGHFSTFAWEGSTGADSDCTYSSPQYSEFQYTKSYTIGGVVLYPPDSYPECMPKDWKLKAWNGSSWVDIIVATNSIFTVGQGIYFPTTVSISANKFRFEISKINKRDYLLITELELYLGNTVATLKHFPQIF